MKKIKKLILLAVVAISFLNTACTEESEVVIPEYETTEGTKAEGTNGEDVDPD